MFRGAWFNEIRVFVDVNIPCVICVYALVLSVFVGVCLCARVFVYHLYNCPFRSAVVFGLNGLLR